MAKLSLLLAQIVCIKSQGVYVPMGKVPPEKSTAGKHKALRSRLPFLHHVLGSDLDSRASDKVLGMRLML